MQIKNNEGITMKKMSVLVLMTAMLLLTSCGSFSGGDLATTGTAAAVGGLTYKAFEDDPNAALYGIGAAGLTYIGGKYLQNKWDDQVKEAYKTGYTEGMANATILHYESIQNLQKRSKNQKTVEYQEYTFPGASERNGIKYVPHNIKLRTVK